jgi:hypothetical protein
MMETEYDLTPKASSTKRPANRIKGEDIGRYVTISAIPSLVISLGPACLVTHHDSQVQEMGVGAIAWWALWASRMGSLTESNGQDHGAPYLN